MVEPRLVALLAAKELRDARRNRWFLLAAGIFTVAALGLSWLSAAGAAGTGFSGWSRSGAGLVNLVVLIVPLLGLMLGAATIAGERDRGTLALLMSQPLGAWDLVLGKFCGATAAVTAALGTGFGLAAAVMAASGVPGSARPLVACLGFAVLLAAVGVALGIAISAVSRRGAVAAGVALAVWLGLMLFADLGIMGSAVVLRLSAREVLFAALVNPLQVYKLAALTAIRGGLEVLGPAGLYASRSLGSGLLPLLVAILGAWIAVPLAAAGAALARREGAS